MGLINTIRHEYKCSISTYYLTFLVLLMLGYMPVNRDLSHAVYCFVRQTTTMLFV